MKLFIQDLKTPRQWRSAVGCDAHQFDELAGIFTQAYATLNGLQLADRMVLDLIGTHMKDETNLLFFTLFSCKYGLTYDVLGLVCGMDAASAKRRQDEGLAVLHEALRLADCLPEREFQSPAELQRYFSKRRALLLDATEFTTQRPQKKTAQKAQYSGKKTPYAQSPCRFNSSAKNNLCQQVGARKHARFHAVKETVTAGQGLVRWADRAA